MTPGHPLHADREVVKGVNLHVRRGEQFHRYCGDFVEFCPNTKLGVVRKANEFEGVEGMTAFIEKRPAKFDHK